MSSEIILLPNLNQEQKEFFQKALVRDLDDLKTNAAISPSFCDLFVSLSKAPSVSLFTDKEAQAIVQLTDPSRKQAAVLKSIDDKGPQAIVIFYLLLHMNNEVAYAELPSCKENDEKMELISTLRDRFLHQLQNKIAGIMSTSKVPSHDVAKPTATVATVKPLRKASKKEEDISIDASAIEKNRWKDKEDEKLTTLEKAGNLEKHRVKPQRRSWGIKKDDEFFHFIIVCFALGAVLVSEYYYADWTVSAGIGLITFATLEATGIYFNLIDRIRNVVQGLLPLLGKSPLGINKQA
ncbi:transmembrane protein 40 [Pseudophryne corroboree]|uniref:transmembrane protein 40 n=1 Tax=Pseudophryne corroboree TaxID=495146 RepID=UPI003081C279